MLVLTRHEKQAIYIGDDIVIRVVKIKSGQVQLGIEAPKNVPIHRDDMKEGGSVRRT